MNRDHPEVPPGTELRRRARAEALPFLSALALPDPADAVRAWTKQVTTAQSAAQVHVLLDAQTGSEASTLLALRDLLRAAAAWCRDRGQPALAERYLRTSDLLDITDRQLYQLGVDHLSAFHTRAPQVRSDRKGPTTESH
ncbi:hypothetical protein BJP40_03815 [Streptomyces sp. CC53]|uniref:hypothetical protein n=1 Tax=Streptomyces sp. CC53 TaxID=1906740 RepID=UPI00091E7591|nr:hypothetical protein [Streptomyces sp. CC53]OII62140.1 hypothetical protein BJP40_03815 [Streptomyces sp. CC53]